MGPCRPKIFIRVAEERGLIDQLGHRVLEEACRFAAGTSLVKISVNMSPVQLRNPGFVAMVLRTLEGTGLEPTRLELELTEKVVLEETSEIKDAIGQLRAAGILIALDDFATGNSSLQYLRDHRVNSVKIDRSFIAGLGKDEECEHLVRAIFGLARAMGISVTVEGVETELQQSLLASMGCKKFQGFLLHRPLDPDRFAAVLHEESLGKPPASA
ncbi:GGDEF domain-containing phosphodiesterase [Frigidibacter albus]